MSFFKADPFRNVNPTEAETLVGKDSVHVLDVRTPGEYERLGHIPGATLLPLDLVAAAPAVLAEERRPVLVYCEHGVRSRQAAQFLARAGVPDVINMTGGMSVWRGARERTSGDVAGVSPWLLETAPLLPRGGRALDVACGAGRHALLLASAGFKVDAVDRDPDRVAGLEATARRLGLPVRAHVADLEGAEAGLEQGAYDLVLVVHYLHRPLFPALLAALAPGGLLLYETFTTAQAEQGQPTNPDYLLAPGELRERVQGLEILREREGESQGRQVAAVAARRPV